MPAVNPPVYKEEEIRPIAVPARTAACLLCVSERTLANMRSGNTVVGDRGPRWAKVGGRAVYRLDDIEEYLESRMVDIDGSRKGVDFET